ncbi:MAG: 2-oxoacid:acceptor oxidoreductase family protein [Pirellulales bacterium]|nr:2-oxoacid:acceptor oxidoreductase family protein [Pirellulales bacterium]
MPKTKTSGKKKKSVAPPPSAAKKAVSGKKKSGKTVKKCPPVEATKEILLAGSGGQGLILAGKMLAQAAVAEGFNATYIPSYGAEVRGGTAHCHVKVGHRPIGSPIVEDATIIVVMNEPSYRAFSPLLRKGSTLVVNSSLVPTVGKHPGVKIVELDLTKIASDMGSLRSANMLVLGLCAGLLGMEDRKLLSGLLNDTLGKKNPALLDTNQQILAKGVDLGEEVG